MGRRHYTLFILEHTQRIDEESLNIISLLNRSQEEERRHSLKSYGEVGNCLMHTFPFLRFFLSPLLQLAFSSLFENFKEPVHN